MSASSSPGGATQSVSPPRQTGDVAGRARRARGWLWVPVGVVLALLKAHILVDVIGHRGGAITLLAAWLATALLRMRLVSVALAAAALFGILDSSHSFGRGLAFGGAAFVVLMGAFLAIATLLLARQDAG